MICCSLNAQINIDSIYALERKLYNKVNAVYAFNHFMGILGKDTITINLDSAKIFTYQDQTFSAIKVVDVNPANPIYIKMRNGHGRFKCLVKIYSQDKPSSIISISQNYLFSKDNYIESIEFVDDQFIYKKNNLQGELIISGQLNYKLDKYQRYFPKMEDLDVCGTWNFYKDGNHIKAIGLNACK